MKLRQARKLHFRMLKDHTRPVRASTWKRVYDKLGPHALMDWLNVSLRHYEMVTQSCKRAAKAGGVE